MRYKWKLKMIDRKKNYMEEELDKNLDLDDLEEEDLDEDFDIDWEV